MKMKQSVSTRCLKLSLAALLVIWSCASDALGAGERVILVVDHAIRLGETGTVVVEMDANGDENAIGFSLEFDPDRLTYQSATGGSGAAFTINALQASSGRVGVLMGLLPPQVFPQGRLELLSVTFSAGTIPGDVTLSFGDIPIFRDVSDVTSSSLSTAFSAGKVTVMATPVADSQSVVTDEDIPKTITLTGSRIDTGMLSFATVASPTLGTLSGTPPNLTYTPNANVSGADSFTFKVNDGLSDSDVATVSITINPVNDAPVLTVPTDQTITELTTLDVIIGASDLDAPANILSFALVSGPSGAVIDSTTGRLTWRPTDDQAPSSNLITVQVTDNGFPSLNATKVFTVVVSELALRVAGRVHFWKTGEAVPGVAVGLAGKWTYSALSDTLGTYALTSVRPVPGTLSFSKSDDINGITAFDASLVLQHAVDLRTLSGAEAIAADVNKSGTITAMDASYILRKAVGLIDVPFPNAGVVWEFAPSTRVFASLESDKSDQDATAVLIGDVSGNWANPLELQRATASRGEIQLASSSPLVRLGVRESFELESGRTTARVLVNSPSPVLYGLDLMISYNAARTLKAIRAGSATAEPQWAINSNVPGRVRVGLAAVTPFAAVGELLKIELEGSPSSDLRIVEASINEGRVPVYIDSSGSLFDQDSDGDGSPDWEGAVAGTGPSDQRPVIAIRTVRLDVDGRRTITWSSVPDREYVLQYKNTLSERDWKDLAIERAEGWTASMVDRDTECSSQRFYRIRVHE